MDYEYLDHTADAKFIAYGQTLEEAFVNCAKATFGIIIDCNTERSCSFIISQIPSPDRCALIIYSHEIF